MVIIVETTPSELSDTKTIKLENLNLSEDEWNALNEDEQEEKLNDYLSDLSEQPTWMVDRFKTKK